MIPHDPWNTQSRGESNWERVKKIIEAYNLMVQLVILTTLDIVKHEMINLIWLYDLLSNISMFHINKFHMILNDVLLWLDVCLWCCCQWGQYGVWMWCNGCKIFV